ncbi:MAG: hypothetical protein WCX93_08500 [Burkholderiaceae bacterium]
MQIQVEFPPVYTALRIDMFDRQSDAVQRIYSIGGSRPFLSEDPADRNGLSIRTRAQDRRNGQPK